MQPTIVKIQPKGLLTIPIKFRKALSLEENNLVRAEIDKGRLIIEPLRTLPYPVRSYTEKELKNFLKKDLKDSKELKKKGLI